MTKRTIFATIAVAIIAGVSIFVACTKEEKKDRINSSNKDLSTELNMTPGELHNMLLINSLQHPYYGTASEYTLLQQDYALLQSLGMPTDITFDAFVDGVDTTGVEDDISLYEMVLADVVNNNYSDFFVELSYKLNRAGTIISIDSFLTYMQLMQDTIAMYADLSEHERNVLTGAISIGIKSAIFWEYDYPNMIDSLVARARRSENECSNCNCFIDRDPNFTCRENARVRWADVKGWFRKNNSTRCISAESASRRKHQEIVNEHGDGYTQDE